MAHYARINGLTHKVENVIRCDADFIESLPDKDFWIKTSYNTFGGVYYDPETKLPVEDQSVIEDDIGRKRKNFAAFGYTYDVTKDAFIPPKPKELDSWTLNETSCQWEAPTPYPDDGNRYTWNESTTSWDVVPEQE